MSGPFGEDDKTTPSDLEHPGYCIPIGESAVVQGRPIRIDPDAFFGKHAAILGSTGAGKSCTIASIIQSILKQSEIKRTTFVILDTNGEYQSAFLNQHENKNGNSMDGRYYRYISSDPSDADHIVIPYWFMNIEDFVRLFQASKGVQRPVLLEALRLARSESSSVSPLATLREELIRELNRIWSLSGKDENTSKGLRNLAKGLKQRIKDPSFNKAWRQDSKAFGFGLDELKNTLEEIENIAKKYIEENKYPGVIPADARHSIQNAIEPFYEKLTGTRLGEHGVVFGYSDAPSYFDKFKFRSMHIEQVLRREESVGARARDYSGTMLLRIDRLLADQRFDFLFGPTGESLPNAKYVLATFLRDVIGLESASDHSKPLSDEEAASKEQFEVV